MEIAKVLIAQFEHMVRRDGGSLSLIGADDTTIRVGYRMGSDVNCDSGACVLPHIELQELMNETISRRAPTMKVVVQVIS